MSDVSFENNRNHSVSFEGMPQIKDQCGDVTELSMDELDEVNGGLLPLLMAGAFFAVYGAMAFYHDSRGR